MGGESVFEEFYCVLVYKYTYVFGSLKSTKLFFPEGGLFGLFIKMAAPRQERHEKSTYHIKLH